MREGWLECTISPGQFSGEYAVSGILFDGAGFSLFADRNDLRYVGEPEKKQSVEGAIRVFTLASRDNLVLVALPQGTLENGNTITVKREAVTASTHDSIQH